jgi:hypothetical protein
MTTAAEHYRIAEAASAKLTLASSPLEAARAVTHGLLAVAGAIVLKDLGSHYPDPHADLIDAVLGRPVRP